MPPSRAAYRPSLCALLVALAALSSFDAKAEAGGRVAEVRVEGAADGGAADSIRAIFGVRPGDPLMPGDVRLGLKRVFLTGPWADVRVYAEPAAGGVALVVVVVPDLVISEVTIEAKGGLPTERLRPAAGLSPGDRFRPERVEAATRQLRHALAELGYPRPEIEAEIRAVGGADHAVRFRIDPGEPTRVRSLRVVGDPALSQREIEELLGTREGQPFDRVRLERGFVEVRELLVRRRHLRAATAVEDVAYGKNERDVQLTVRIDAGPRYHVAFQGNAVIASAYLKGVVNERRVGALDEASQRKAVRTLEDFYRANGYAHVKVTSDDVPAFRPYDEHAERVLRFVIEEGPRAEVRELLVEGATLKDGHELEAELWRFLRAEAPEHGLVQRVDAGDLKDLLEGEPRPIDEPRATELPEEVLELVPALGLIPGLGLSRRPAYVEPLFERAAQHLEDVYRKLGFLEVEVHGPEPIWLEDGAVARVRYRVHEGTQTRIAAVRFLPAPSLPLAELLTEAAFEPGDPADLYAIEETRVTVENNLKERGFPFARVNEQLVKLPEPGLAEVVYAIEEGPRVRIGQVHVRGNHMTRDFVIVDRVVLRPGDFYASSKVEASRQRLLRMGLFSSVSIGFLDDKADATQRDLLVQVRERHRYSVEAGFGASIEDGPRVFSAVEVRNILGFGLGLRGRAQVNYPRLLYDFVYDADDQTSPLRRFDSVPPSYRWAMFTEGQFMLTGEMPKVYGLPFDARLHLDAVGLREIRPAFTLMKASILGGFEAQPATWLHIEPQVEAETSDFDCLTLGEGCEVALTRKNNDSGVLGQVTLRLLSSLDLRDDPFRPHSGVFSSVTTDLALGAANLRASPDLEEPLGDRASNFVKVAGMLSGYVPLAPDFTLALTLRGGNIFPLDGALTYVPPYKSFYLGGTGSVRGFFEDEILPSDHKDWPATQRDPSKELEGDIINQGGNFFVNARTELRMSAVGDLEFGTFVDAGQLAEDVTRVQLAGWAIGAGFGLRYNTPVGPFAVDLAWKVIDGQRRLPPLLDAERMNLHFSIGYF